MNKLTPKPLWINMDESNNHIQYQLKYFPKYYTEVIYKTSDLYNAKLLHRVKTTKVIRVFKMLDTVSARTKDRVKRILQPHRRNISHTNIQNPAILISLPYLSEFMLNTMNYHSWRAFYHSLKYKKLNIDFIESYSHKNHDSRQLKAMNYLRYYFWRHLKTLHHLKDLTLHFCNTISQIMLHFLIRLNASSPLLQNLESLTLFINHLNSTELSSISLENVLQYTTAFKVFEASFKTLEHMLNQSHCFKNLSTVIIIKTTQLYPQDTHPVNLSGLQALQSLQNLQKMELSLNLSHPQSLLSFLGHFCLPKSAISIKLILYEIAWDTLCPDFIHTDWKTGKTFTQLESCVQFYDQWREAVHLTDLSLCFAEAEADSIPSLYFILPILQGLTSLSTLYYSNWCNTKSNKKALDFGHFWNEMGNARETIRKLYIESYAITLRSLESDISQVRNLTELGLCGVVLGDGYLKNLVSLLSKEHLSTFMEHSAPLIEIERLVIDDDKSFVDFSESLRHISKRMRLLLHVDVRNVSLICFMQSLTEVVQSMPVKKLLRLTFRNTRPLSHKDLKELSNILWNHKVFGNLVILSRFESEMFSYERRSSSRVSGVLAEEGSVESIHSRRNYDHYNSDGDNDGEEEMGSEEDSEDIDEDGFDLSDPFLSSEEDIDDIDEEL